MCWLKLDHEAGLARDSDDEKGVDKNKVIESGVIVFLGGNPCNNNPCCPTLKITIENPVVKAVCLRVLDL